MSTPSSEITPEKQARFTHYLRQQVSFQPQPVRDADLSGKAAIVTGSSSGVGLETGRQLLLLGLSRLIVAVRDLDKGRAAAADLRSSLPPGATNAVVEVWELDLNDYESVIAFVQKSMAKLDRLDYVVLNAGLCTASQVINPQTGHDEMIQVNYLSTALLAILLLPVAKAKRSGQSAPTRITFTSSEVASWAKFDLAKHVREGNNLLGALDSPAKDYDPLDRMMVSKLLGQFLISHLARYVPADIAIINGASPGAVHDSEFARHTRKTVAGAIAQKVQRLFANTSAVGARMMTDAIVRHGAESHGKFLSFQKAVPMAPIIYTDIGNRISQQLWDETLEELSFCDCRNTMQSLAN